MIVYSTLSINVMHAIIQIDYFSVILLKTTVVI